MPESGSLSFSAIEYASLRIATISFLFGRSACFFFQRLDENLLYFSPYNLHEKEFFLNFCIDYCGCTWIFVQLRAINLVKYVHIRIYGQGVSDFAS